MYIQQDGNGSLPFTLPQGYRGNAFTEEPREAPSTIPVEETPPPQATDSEAPSEEATPSTPAGAFGKLPFLSSLLPPPRRKKEGGCLPEWAVVALIFFVLNDSREGDLLPLLLLLLLWD